MGRPRSKAEILAMMEYTMGKGDEYRKAAERLTNNMNVKARIERARLLALEAHYNALWDALSWTVRLRDVIDA